MTPAHDEIVTDLTRRSPYRPCEGASEVARLGIYGRIAPEGTTIVPALPVELSEGNTTTPTGLLAGQPPTLGEKLGFRATRAVPAPARVPNPQARPHVPSTIVDRAQFLASLLLLTADGTRIDSVELFDEDRAIVRSVRETGDGDQRRSDDSHLGARFDGDWTFLGWANAERQP